jgi:queuine tRNA-ribosyltransferase
MAKEMLGPTLLTIHNLTYYQDLMAEARAAIEAGTFAAFRRLQYIQWESSDDQVEPPRHNGTAEEIEHD